MEKKLQAAGVFVITFFVMYILSAVIIWVSLAYFSSIETQQLSERYIKKHEKTLKEEIFHVLFRQAESCLHISNEILRRQCEASVGHDLAVFVKEEELVESDGYSWPHDLFFVKQTGDQFFRLGWNGKLDDISSSVQKRLVDANIPYMIRQLTRQCKPFDAPLNDLSDCYLYVSLDLGNNEKGYMVRRIGLTEEDDLSFLVFIPPLALGYALQLPFTGYFSLQEFLPIVVFVGISIVLPILVASFITGLYLKGLPVWVKRKKRRNKIKLL